MLDVLGISATTESVYRAMLAHPHDGVADLGSRLGVAVTVVRAALDELSELSLVRPSTADDGRLHAVSPHLAMDMLLARQQAELAEQQRRVEESRAAAIRLISEYADSTSDVAGTDVQFLEGIDTIRDHLRATNDDVRHDLMAFAPGGAQSEANMRSSRPLNERLRERGVRLRTIYLDSIRNDPATVAHAEWLTSIGAEVRTVPTLPNRMNIYDRRTAIVARDCEDTAAGAVVLRSPGIVTSLCALFESYWHAGEDFGAPAAAPPGDEGLTRQQREALRLLAEGHTDEAIAKRLGVSARTARRVATKLLAYLGARSRFQAGVNAVRRGMIAD